MKGASRWLGQQESCLLTGRMASISHTARLNFLLSPAHRCCLQLGLAHYGMDIAKHTVIFPTGAYVTAGLSN